MGSLTWPIVILSDRTIREQLAAGRIVIDPLDETLIQPSSIDVRISNLFRVFRNHTRGVIDVKQDMVDLTELVEIPDGSDEPFMLHPGEFVLGSTLERIVVPDDLVGRTVFVPADNGYGAEHTVSAFSDVIPRRDLKGYSIRITARKVNEERRRIPALLHPAHTDGRARAPPVRQQDPYHDEGKRSTHRITKMRARHISTTD